MERQLPRNVRQIGNVSDSPKIYVEDYVDTFFRTAVRKNARSRGRDQWELSLWEISSRERMKSMSTYMEQSRCMT